MNPVFQKIIDRDKGDCMRAAICTLLNIEDCDVPNFTEGDYQRLLIETLDKNGCDLKSMLWNPKLNEFYNPTESCFVEIKYNKQLQLPELRNFEGIDGYFVASVFSPKYFNYTDGFHSTHAVVIDKDFNIVHDPNPYYQGIRHYPLSDLIGYNGIRDVFVIERV